jgi:hypothetical protein
VVAEAEDGEDGGACAPAAPDNELMPMVVAAAMGRG